jgi:hypothetical protein
MTNQEYIDCIEPFARRVPFGHDPESNVVRFAQYEISAESFMPDMSRYKLDLSNFCLLISHLDIDTKRTENGQNRRIYETNFLIVKSCEVGNYEQEAAAINDAQLRAEWLWAAMEHHEHCVVNAQKKKGKFFQNLRLGSSFKQNDLTGLTDNCCGVEIQLSFFEDITHQYIASKYPDWN